MALKLSDCKAKLGEYHRTHGSLMGINRIGIFGSVAREENTDMSDIDIVVDLARPSLQVMAQIRQQLQTIFGCDIDLIRYRNSLRPRFKQSIDKEAIYV